MKRIKKYFPILILFITIISLSGCDKQIVECGEFTDVKYNFLQLEGGSFTLKNLEVNKEVKLIISSQADYEKYVSSNLSLPAIDFKKNILICGRTYLTTCGILKSQSFLRRCNDLIYTINLERLDCQKPEEIFHFAIIPKSVETLNIIFETKIKE